MSIEQQAQDLADRIERGDVISPKEMLPLLRVEMHFHVQARAQEILALRRGDPVAAGIIYAVRVAFDRGLHGEEKGAVP